MCVWSRHLDSRLGPRVCCCTPRVRRDRHRPFQLAQEPSGTPNVSGPGALPAEWKSSFDLVHQRLAPAASGPIQNQIVGSLGGLVRPGGWIQLIERVPQVARGGILQLHHIIKGIYSRKAGRLLNYRRFQGPSSLWIE